MLQVWLDPSSESMDRSLQPPGLIFFLSDQQRSFCVLEGGGCLHRAGEG